MSQHMSGVSTMGNCHVCVCVYIWRVGIPASIKTNRAPNATWQIARRNVFNKLFLLFFQILEVYQGGKHFCHHLIIKLLRGFVPAVNSLGEPHVRSIAYKGNTPS